MNSFGGLVLAGGKGKRMGGCQKALLPFQGHTFLQHLEAAFSGFDELLLSSNDPALAAGTRFQVVMDEKPGQGPLEGLRAALSICKSDGLVVTTCDTPLFSSTLAQLLMEACQGCSAVACMDRKGRLHPLCGVYRKACVPVIEAALSEGIFRVQEVFQQAGGIIFPLAGTEIPDETLYNVNTQEEFAALTMKNP
ncbi:molybdenum cofactor guanylyltransferase [bacterium 1XD42-1]|nr:molybdenum cofactor guanylyltransferase [bacterium 1XD42-8]RKJ66623.1 molybdenum cofactor guanylyltransferase [bacterium 1XD42-1]